MVRPRPRGQTWQVAFSLAMRPSARLPARTRAHQPERNIFLNAIEVFDASALQPRPRRAAVGRLEDACAADAVNVEIAFARAGVDDVGIFRIHRQRTDREVGHQVGQWRPERAAVGRLPHAARHARGVHHAGVRRMDEQRAGALGG